jgi:hypothetical protein
LVCFALDFSSFSFFCCNCRWLLSVLHIMYFCSFYGFLCSSSSTFFPTYCSFLCTLWFKFLLCTSMSIPSIRYITSHVIYYMSPFESSLQS